MFKLSIRLGNASMETPPHVADALGRLALRLDQYPDWHGDAHEGRISDLNGNVVGEWRITRAQAGKRRVA